MREDFRTKLSKASLSGAICKHGRGSEDEQNKWTRVVGTNLAEMAGLELAMKAEQDSSKWKALHRMGLRSGIRASTSIKRRSAGRSLSLYLLQSLL